MCSPHHTVTCSKVDTQTVSSDIGGWDTCTVLSEDNKIGWHADIYECNTRLVFSTGVIFFFAFLFSWIPCCCMCCCSEGPDKVRDSELPDSTMTTDYDNPVVRKDVWWSFGPSSHECCVKAPVHRWPVDCTLLQLEGSMEPS